MSAVKMRRLSEETDAAFIFINKIYESLVSFYINMVEALPPDGYNGIIKNH